MSFIDFLNEEKENEKFTAGRFVEMYNNLTGSKYVYVRGMRFKNRFGLLKGYLYLDGTKALRVNFNRGMHSVSSWKSYGSSPDVTVLKGNIKEMIGVLKMTTYDLDDRNVIEYNGRDYGDIEGLVIGSYVNKNISMHKLEDDLKEHGVGIDEIKGYLKKYSRYNNKGWDVDKLYREEGKDEDVKHKKVYVDVEEKEVESKYDKFNDDMLVDQIIADPLPVFRKLNSYVLMTAKRINNALLITGQGGVGKSYNVNRILKTFGTEGRDYVIMKGASSTVSMYQFLYENYNKIVVFDDCDSVLTNDDALNILKGALDSGRSRRISYNKNKSNIVNTFDCKDHDEIEKRLEEWSDDNDGKVAIPSTFEFKGGVIFISNLSAEKMSQGKAAALLTRCMCVDIKLMASEVILRMESCLPHIKVYDMDGRDITNEEIKKETFDWISSDEYLNDPRIKDKEISFRLFNKVYMYRYARLGNWKELSFCV